MQQHLYKELTAGGQTHAPRRSGVGDHDTVGRKASLRKWGTTAAAGVLLPLLSAWARPWSGVAAGMEQGAHRMPYLLAVGIGTLSWLAGVIIIAALLFGAMLLLHALVQLYPVSFEPFPLRGRCTRQKTGQETSSAHCIHSMGRAVHPAPIAGTQTRPRALHSRQ